MSSVARNRSGFSKLKILKLFVWNNKKIKTRVNCTIAINNR